MEIHVDADGNVDEAATASLRKQMASKRGKKKIFDRGFESIEELKSRCKAETGFDPPAAPLTYRLPAFDLTVEFRPTDFVQVNGELNEHTVARVVALLDALPTDSVLDLFCGLGNFTLPLARRAHRVAGVEGDAGLVARARANAARNGIANAVFHVADLPAAPQAGWAGEAWDKVLLDPPRVGAAAVLQAAAAARPARIVYVSCHPGSLARDAGTLVHEHGFGLVAAGVMDMFPHTAHVEAVAVFEPR